MGSLLRFFEIRRDETGAELERYRISASHKWATPGVVCPDCGGWTSIGFQYPSVDLSALPNAPRFSDRAPVPIEVYEDLIAPILPLMPDRSIPCPGTEFGPVVGRLKGSTPSLCWSAGWTLLGNQTAIDALQQAGLRFPQPVPARIVSSLSREAVELFEFEIWPRGHLAPQSYERHRLRPMAQSRKSYAKAITEEHVREFAESRGMVLASGSSPPTACPICRAPRGRVFIYQLVLEAASVPPDTDIFRLTEAAPRIVVTDRFRVAVRDLELTGVVFDEVELV